MKNKLRKDQEGSKKPLSKIEEEYREYLRHKNYIPPVTEGHGMPITRRDFLARGFISGAGTLLVPNVLTALFGAYQAKAEGLNCGETTSGDSNIPLIQLDAAGGMQNPGTNVMVGGAGGQADYLPAASYTSIGLPVASAPSSSSDNVAVEMGALFFAGSAFLAGLRSTASAQALANAQMVIVPGRTSDDSDSNRLSVAGHVIKAAGEGEAIGAIGPNANRPAKGRHLEGNNYQTFSSQQIRRLEDVRGLVEFGALQQLPMGKLERVLKSITRSSMSQIAKFSQNDLSQQLRDFIHCQYLKTEELVASASTDIDPEQDSDLNAVFNLNNNQEEVFGSSLMAAVKGYSKVTTMEYGGRDYHGPPRTTALTLDTQYGASFGQALEYAQRRGKPCFFYLTTDGGISCGGGTFNSNGFSVFDTQSDSGLRSVQLMVFFDPVRGRPEVGTTQLGGYFNNSGANETSAWPGGNDPEFLAAAIAANYFRWVFGDAARAKYEASMGAASPSWSQVEPYITVSSRV